MRKITLALSLAAMLPLASQAQRYLGIATSNWSGTSGVYLNPANLGDSRHKLLIDLGSINVTSDKNFTTGLSVSKLINAGSGTANAFKFSAQDDDKYTFSFGTEIRMPGVLYSINKNHGVALTTRARVMAQTNDIDGRLFRNALDSTASSTGNFNSAGSSLNMTAHLWKEIGLSYGGVIYSKDKHQIKGGLSVRYLMGGAQLYTKTNSLDITYYGGSDSATLRNTDIEFGSNINDNYAITDYFFKSTGSGVGLDLGLVYEYRPKYQNYKYDMDGKTNLDDLSKNQYKLRFAISVIDIGAVKYRNNNQTLTVKNPPGVSNNINLLSFGTVLFEGTDSINKYLQNRGFASSKQAAESKIALPTSLIVGVDYNIYKNFYVNATYFANMVSQSKIGNNYYSQFTVTPRYDVKSFSFGLPITYSALNSNIRVGAGLRAGPIFLGSDHLFASGDKYGTNFYFGANIPLVNKKKPKDDDGDLVSNKKDKCRGEKGVWELRGCPNPDKDGDGVLDKDDKCPDIAGSKTAMGCPDADLDSVADAEDRCPQESGAVALQGCPDRDNDNVADMDDACPDVAGLPQYKGCPDTDGDGIGDNEDQCPQAAGAIANQGCPDTDADGIADNLDKCPTVKGVAENFGCPEVSVEVKKRLAFAATAIQFETGKASIKKSSFKLLDEIVKILNDYPDYMMSIEGHTDNVGSDVTNLKVSRDRANSVKNYFVSKGISADRLSADGFGESKPVANNKTAAGRAKNRRVAMDLKLKN